MKTTEELVLPLVNSYIEYWAKQPPDAIALIQHEDGRSFTYKKFEMMVDFFALKLLDMGIRKVDTIATLLVLLPEHIFLMYACFKIGAIIAPLDVRLQDDEVVRDIGKIKAKAFFFLDTLRYGTSGLRRRGARTLPVCEAPGAVYTRPEAGRYYRRCRGYHRPHEQKAPGVVENQGHDFGRA